MFAYRYAERMLADRLQPISGEDVVAWLQAEVLAVAPRQYCPQLLGCAQQIENLAQEWGRRLALAGEGSGSGPKMASQAPPLG